MLRKFKTTIKNKLIIGIALFVAMIFSAFPIVHKNNVYAATEPKGYYNDETSSLYSNNNFSTTSSTVTQPNGWTASSNKNDQYSDDYISGIVNFKNMISYEEKVELDSFWERYGLLTSPTIDTSNAKTQSALMINAKNFDGNKNYSTNKTISLDKNSYYKISVSAFSYVQKSTNEDYVSEQTDPCFSIYLKDFSDSKINDQAKFERISNDKFTNYNFYVQTNEYKGEALNLELWLGDNNNFKTMGAVFFSHIQITKYSENLFADLVDSNVNKNNDGSNIYLSLSTPETIDLIKNPSFENNFNNWSINSNSNLSNSFVNVVDLNSSSNYPNTTNNKVEYIPGSTYSLTAGNSALLISKAGKGKLTVESDAFKVDRFGLYKITVYAKSDCVTENNISLLLNDKTKNTTISSVSQNIKQTSSSDNKYINSWTPYTFYVKGNSLEDKNISISVSINGAEEDSKNYVFIDDIKVEKINNSIFTDNSKTENTLDLNNSTSIFLIKNYTFNDATNSNTSVSYPLTPANWTMETTNSQATNSGIVNLNHVETVLENTDLSNNFLMIDNANNLTKTSFKSDSISLSSNSYYYITFKVATTCLDGNVSFVLKTTGDTPSILYKQENIVSHNDWTKYKAYIKTGSESTSAIVELSSSAQGEAYFDEIIVKSSTEDTFNANKDSITSIDFTNDTFEIVEDGNNDLYKAPYTWTANAKNNDFSSTKHGITNPLTNSEINDIISTAKEGNSVLYINNFLTDTYFYYTKNNSTTLTQGKYYKISVWVKTDNISSETQSLLTEEDKLGASVILTYGEDTQNFFGINTNGEYKEVIFYVQPSEDTSLKISLGLGNEKTSASGSVCFDNLTITTIETYEEYETEFNEVSKNDDIICASVVEKEIKTQKPAEDNKQDFQSQPVDWLVIPSLITGIAIFVAIVGFIIRKYFLNRKRTKVKTSYDRKKTVNKELNTQEKINAKESIIEDLKLELEQINADIKVFESESNKRIESIESRHAYQIKTLKSEIDELTNSKNEKLTEKNKLISIDKTNVDTTIESGLNAEINRIDKELSANQKRLNSVLTKIDKVKNEIELQTEQIYSIKTNIENEIAKLEEDVKKIKESITPEFETRRSKKGLTNKKDSIASSNSTSNEQVINETSSDIEIQEDENSAEELSEDIVEIEEDNKNE